MRTDLTTGDAASDPIHPHQTPRIRQSDGHLFALGASFLLLTSPSRRRRVSTSSDSCANSLSLQRSQWEKLNMTSYRKKDASTRLIKPTLAQVNVDEILDMVDHWDPDWEYNGEIEIYDEGIAQYLLVGPSSHSKFYASLILGKPSLRCSIVPEEPFDELEEQAESTFQLIYGAPLSIQGKKDIEQLQQILSKRGFRFQ